MLPELKFSLVDNFRYTIDYIEGEYEETKQPFFKIFIRNKISAAENFIIVAYDLRDIIIKIKPVLPPEEGDIDTQIFSIEKFTKGKLRRMFFELFQARIIADTLPKKKKKKALTKKEPIPNPYIAVLKEEIDRLRMISERNNQMILQANAKKQSILNKRRKEIYKMLGKKDDIKELQEKNQE